MSDRADRVADPDHAPFEDLGPQPAAVYQGFPHPASRQRLQMRARLAQPDALEKRLADPEPLADQVIEQRRRA